MTREKVISCRIPIEEYEEIKRLAEKRDESVSRFIRQAIRWKMILVRDDYDRV